MTEAGPIALTSLALAASACTQFLWNLLLYRRAPRLHDRQEEDLPRVSILIPARNEEANIGAAVQAALASRAVETEVIVLDDDSEDRTVEIITAMATADARVRLISGAPLPEGWCGKQFACHQLGTAAAYPHLLFVDADVRLEADTARRLSDHLARGKAALVSGIPRQELVTWSEKLIIPLIHFVLLAYLPIWAMRRFHWQAFGAACGQLVLLRADAYREIGGHEPIRASLHDGITLPKAFRRAGFMTDLVDATDLATCRLYHNAREVWHGLTKNATEGLGAPGTIIPMGILLIGGQVLPYILLGAALLSRESPSSLPVYAAAVVLTLIPRLAAVARFKQPLLSALLHPVGIAILEVSQWFALVREKISGKSSWKGRVYSTAAAK